MANGGAAPEISLDEVSRLIRMLGMLGSSHDAEVLVAARFVVRWIADHSTDWETLLVPEEPGVSGVAVGALDQDTREALEDIAYQQGYEAGRREEAALQAAQRAQHAQRAQAAMAGFAPGASGGAPAGAAGGIAGQNAQAAQGGWINMSGLAAGLGGALGGLGGSRQQTTQTAPRQPPAGSGGRHAGSMGGLRQTPPPWAQGSWQWVCQELGDRHLAGIPGVFRGSREEQFVADLLLRGFPSLTPAQDKWLRDIAARNGLSW